MPDLQMRTTPGSEVVQTSPGQWRMTIPPGPPGRYRWAQLDDYMQLPRAQFCWQAPLVLTLSARVSNQAHNGTWGFGFWNDPFNFNLGIGGASRRLPALPNAAWFFHASPENYLSFRADQPASGMLAAVFSAPTIPSPFLAPGAMVLPLLLSAKTTGLVRHLLRAFVKEEARAPGGTWKDWRQFSIAWKENAVTFKIDGDTVLHTRVSPRGRMGLVIWIDNQYASLAPGKRFDSGTLETTQTSWLEIKNLHIQTGTAG